MNKRSCRVLCHVLVLCVCVTLINCHIKLFGYKLHGSILRTLYRMSISDCYRACVARGSCYSYTYHVQSKSCLLNSAAAGSSGATLSKVRGYTYAPNTNWPQANVVCSPTCSNTETCDQASATCKVTECSPPSIGYSSYMKGNVFATGSRVIHVCARNAYNVRQSTCLETGSWSTAGNINYTGAVEGHWFRIHVVGDNTFWHEDGNGDRLISVRYQPHDRWVRFQFILKSDGSYRIKVRDVSVYDGYSVADASYNVLSSVNNGDFESSKFLITQDPNGCLIFRAKKTGRLVRKDEDRILSTRYNIDDEWSKFYLVKL